MLLLYQFWLTEICLCRKPRPIRDEMSDLQIALPMTLMLPFFYTSGNLNARHLHHNQTEMGHFAHHFLFLSFGVAMKGIQFIQLHCRILFLSFTRFTTCFLSSCGRWLNSCKCWLFCLHIQHATRLFEWWTPVGSLESVGSAFKFHYNFNNDKQLIPNAGCSYKEVNVL